ncbi:otospiralin-like [Odontesthes bonariensis]|uniref:otospiralin-like n=1 Tax=Odontesthes bonariensis TaxID=219752 RepID=UPI003F584A7E
MKGAFWLEVDTGRRTTSRVTHIICCSSVTGNMHALYASVLLCSLLLCSPLPSGMSGSKDEEAGAAESEREKRSLPYWGLWSSDFFGWVEELRAQAAESGMQDLARTFWAHFPISRELGYETPEADPPPEE